MRHGRRRRQRDQQYDRYGLSGVDSLVATTDAQALGPSRAPRIIQMGHQLTEGLGAGSSPEIVKAAAEEALEEIRDCLAGSNMVFLAAGMGGGTGTGAAPIIAAAAREMGILTVGVGTKPFHFGSGRRMRSLRPVTPNCARRSIR